MQGTGLSISSPSFAIGYFSMELLIIITEDQICSLAWVLTLAVASEDWENNALNACEWKYNTEEHVIDLMWLKNSFPALRKHQILSVSFYL